MAGSRSNKRRKGANGKRTVDDEPKPEEEDQQQQQQQQQQAQRAVVAHQGPFPAAMVQVIGSYLDGKYMPAARLACKCWAEHIAESTTSFVTLLHPDKDMASKKLVKLAQMFPMASSCTLMVGPRVANPCMTILPDALVDFRRLERLCLTFVSPVEPKNGLSALSKRGSYLKCLTGLPSLTSVTLKNWPFPDSTALEAIGAMPHLTHLVIDSQNFGTRPGEPSGCVYSQLLCPRARDLGALSCLQNLNSLTIKCAKELQHEAELTSLSQLTKLSHLDLGKWACGRTALQAITSLSSLQELHVCARTDEVVRDAALHKLTGLQRLYLSVPGTELVDDLRDYYMEKFSGCLRGFGASTLPSPVFAGIVPALSGLPLERLTATLQGPNHTLACISSLSKLTSLELTKRRPHGCSICGPLTLLFTTAAANLQRLSLESFTNNELPPSLLHEISSLVCLKELTIHGADNTQAMLQVDLAVLPVSIEFLSLKYVYLPCPVFHGRLQKLHTLAMRYCHMACFSHFQTAVEGLRSLRSLDLDDMPHMRDCHLEQLSSLTQLTSLGVGAIGNQYITNLPVGCLSTLTNLHRLRWCAGDMLDAMLDPLFLEPFSKMCIVCIPSSMYWRMSRWNAAHQPPMEHCDFETIGA